MPITQQRMLDLIEAAREYDRAYKTALEFVPPEHQAAAAALRPSFKAIETIATETAHFRKMARRNDYEANRQRARRGSQDAFPVPRRQGRDGSGDGLHPYSPRQPTVKLAPRPTAPGQGAEAAPLQLPALLQHEEDVLARDVETDPERLTPEDLLGGLT